MNISGQEKQLEGVKGWWNNPTIVKWDKKHDDYDIHTMRYLNSRKEKVIAFLKGLNLPKGAKLLELGYGAGQAAAKFGQMGFEVYGLDISEKLCEVAKARCQRECPDGTFDLRVGNIESRFDFLDGYFDVVVVIGALQYLADQDTCLRESFRVLKPGGHFIVAQKNVYSMDNFWGFRKFVRLCVHFFCQEKYELFPSLKSCLVDSRLGLFFKRFKDSKLLNAKFMLKGHDVYKFELKKQNNSYFSLRFLLERSGLRVFSSEGAYYYLFDNPNGYQQNLKIDVFFERLTRKFPFRFLRLLGASLVLLARKSVLRNGG